MTRQGPALRPFHPDDLVIYFQQQQDPIANHMAAFTREDPDDLAAFKAHWAKILADKEIILRTIVSEGARGLVEFHTPDLLSLCVAVKVPATVMFVITSDS